MGGSCSAAHSDGTELVGNAASGKAGDVSGEGLKRHILRYGGVEGKPVHSQLTSTDKASVLMHKSIHTPRSFSSVIVTCDSASFLLP